ncbi:MAG: winged helix-turn-helix domain-containing protein [Gemmatimonadetes bacterium]|nr:winged helix-turn-helix domain-containing protein [Gemmatimonadota bacterium]
MAHRRNDIADRLRQRIVAGLHLGVVAGGQRLPSVRVLASELSADPRVVLAAYRELQAEGLVEVRPRSGIYVAAAAGEKGEALPQLAEWVVDVLVQALGRGVPAIEFPERVRRCLRTVRFRTACIECNRDQITGLCRELRDDYGLDTHGVELQALGGGELPDDVRAADLLVTTPFHAAQVQRVAQALGKPWMAVHLRAGFLREVERFLDQGPVYFVATDPRFAEKLRLIFTPAARAENLRPLIVGRDDLAQVPENAPTYVMSAARPMLQDLPLRARLVPAPRVFSDESARELLSFIVRSNMAAIRDGTAPTPPSAETADEG